MFGWISGESSNSESNEASDGTLGSLWSSIKEKSNAAIQVLKEDLTEFGTTVSSDTTNFVEEKVVPVILAGAGVTDEDEDEEEYETTRSTTNAKGGSELKITRKQNKVDDTRKAEEGYSASEAPSIEYPLLTGFEGQVAALHKDVLKLKEDPCGKNEGKNISREADIDSQLGTSKSLSATCNSLVPSDMDAKTFWCRFYFHLNELEEEEKIRQSLFNGVEGGKEEEGDDVAAWDDMGDLDVDLDVDLDMVELIEDEEEMGEAITTTSSSSGVNTDDKKATTIIADGETPAAAAAAATDDPIVTADVEGGAEEDAAWETVEALEDGDGWAEIDEWS